MAGHVPIYRFTGFSIQVGVSQICIVKPDNPGPDRNARDIVVVFSHFGDLLSLTAERRAGQVKFVTA
jgi:hypothetical protein